MNPNDELDRILDHALTEYRERNRSPEWKIAFCAASLCSLSRVLGDGRGFSPLLAPLP